MSGRLTPKPNFFRGLGQFNQAIAERDLVGVTDRRLMDRLKRGSPITHPNGVPWTASDFFAAYLGALEAPAELLNPPEQQITQELVDQWTQQIRDSFRKLSLVMMSPPATAWLELKEELIKLGIERDELDWVQEMLAGLRETSVEEASRILVKYKKPFVLMALLTVQERYGGETTELKKLLNWRGQLPKPADQAKWFPKEPDLMPEPQRRIGFDPEGRFCSQHSFSLRTHPHHLALAIRKRMG
jgi:hypothetical protein